LHFNSASLVDAAKAYEDQLANGAKMSMAGAMSTAEIGKIFSKLFVKIKFILFRTGANLEEDIMNCSTHSHYERVPNYRDLTPQDEWDLLERGLNRVTDTCILSMRLSSFKSIFLKYGKMQTIKANVIFRMNSCTKCYFQGFLKNITKRQLDVCCS
jgi:deoxyhypusine synthase